MSEEISEEELYEDIYNYLESISSVKSVTIKYLDELVRTIHANTDLSKENCALIVKIFFQEIRNAMLRGELVNLPQLGKFSIRCSSNDLLFPRLSVVKNLRKKINGR